MLWLHNHGYGNAGATSGHLVPDYAAVIQRGWKGIHADLEAHYNGPSGDGEERSTEAPNCGPC